MQPKTSPALCRALALAAAFAAARALPAQGANPPPAAPAPAEPAAAAPASAPANEPAPAAGGRDPFMVSPHFRQNGNRLWSGAQVLPGDIRLRALINTGGDRIAQIAFGKDSVVTVRNGDEIAVPRRTGLFRVVIGKDGVTLQSTSSEEKISVR